MESSLYTPFVLLLQAVWTLAPGLLVAVALRRRELIAAPFVVPVAGLVGCVIGYGAFWLYFADVDTGTAYSWITLAGSIACCATLARQANRRVLASIDVAAPLVLLAAVALFYTGLTFGCTTGTDITSLNQSCHLAGFTGDNLLPQMFADNLVAGHPRELMWDWQGSDRPPLQSGLVLQQYPLIHLAGWHVTGYETLGVLLQVLWLPVVWALCRSARMPGKVLTTVLLLCGCSGFFFYNSVFTWPKLLAGSLATTAFGLLFLDRRTPWTWGLAGLSAGAAMVAHAGAAFTVIPIALVLLLPRYRAPWPLAALAGAVAVAVVAPWTAYQKLFDPPGDMLLRLHLGGAAHDGSLARTLVDAYTRRPLGAVLHSKLLNLTSFVGHTGYDEGLHIAGTGPIGQLRSYEFLYLVPALGPGSLALLALLLPSVRARLRHSVDATRFWLMLAVAALCAAALVLIMLGPPGGLPLVHQGTYGMVILLYVCLSATLATLPRPLTRTIVAAQLTYFAVMWIALVWHGHILHPGYIVLSGVSALAAAATLKTVSARLDSHHSPDAAFLSDSGREVTRSRNLVPNCRCPHRR
jgi:hypothetical protein